MVKLNEISSVTNDMQKWIGYEFESSSVKTPEFKAFANDFKRNLMKQLDVTELTLITFSTGHFYVYGFVKNKHTNKIAYFSISDVRHFSDAWYNNILIRTATSNADYTGGVNRSTTFPDLGEDLLKLTSNELNEAEDLDVKSEFDTFTSTVKNQTFKSKTALENKLKQQLVGKKVIAHSSKGYKQFKKDYEINVTGAKIEDYYGHFEVVLTDDKNKEYFVDRAFKVKIINPSDKVPTPSSGEQATIPPQVPQETPPAIPTQPTGQQTPNIAKEIEK